MAIASSFLALQKHKDFGGKKRLGQNIAAIFPPRQNIQEVGKRSSIIFFLFGTLSVTFWSLFLMLLSLFSTLFCQTPFAGLLLRRREKIAIAIAQKSHHVVHSAVIASEAQRSALMTSEVQPAPTKTSAVSPCLPLKSFNRSLVRTGVWRGF